MAQTLGSNLNLTTLKVPLKSRNQAKPGNTPDPVKPSIRLDDALQVVHDIISNEAFTRDCTYEAHVDEPITTWVMDERDPAYCPTYERASILGENQAWKSVPPMHPIRDRHMFEITDALDLSWNTTSRKPS